MNPYAPLFSNHADIAIAWLCVTIWLVIVGAFSRRRFGAVPIHAERVCSATASAFLLLAAVITLTFGVGLIFLAWLKVTSAFWIFWQLLYLMSVVCVFWVLPFVAVGLICWALIGKWRAGFSARSVKLASVCFPVVFIDAALYFWLCYEIAA
jgi:hypothetical protein